jgi:hypothetical protein
MMSTVKTEMPAAFLLVLMPFLLAAPAMAGSKAKRSRSTRVAVLELGALGMSSGMRKNLELLVTNSIATMPGYRVIPAVDIQMAMRDPRNKAVAECSGGPDCAVQIGRLVGADLVVFGTISTIGEAFSLDLRAMDAKRGRAKARQKSRISGTRDVLIPEVRLATYKLIAPDRIRGALLIEIDVEGVEIEIDGQRVGVTPLAKPVEDLTPGPHIVVLKRPGFSEFRREFEIKPFETAKLKLELGTAGEE